MRLAAAALLIPLLAPPQEPPALEKRISIDKTGTLQELCDEIRRSSGANIHLNPRTAEGPDPEPKISLTLKDVKTLSALRWLASAGHAAVAVREGIAVIGPHSDLRPRLQRPYDTRGLFVRVSDRPGPLISLPDGALIGITVTLDEPRESSVGEEQIIDLIKENVTPGTWEGLTTIERTIEGGLTVNAHADTHEQLAWFLDALKQFSHAPVSLSAEIVEADDETASLLAPGAPVILAAAEVDAVAARIRKARPRLLQTSGLDTQRVHSFHREETSAVIGYLKGESLTGTWLAEAGLLDARPTLVADGRRISVELHLALGQSRALEAAKTIPGPLPRHERTVIRLATTLLIPNGGGALFALPPRDSATARPQICLLRASAPVLPPTPPPLSPAPPPSDLIGRLKALPPADIDLADARIPDLAAWLRRTSGLNVLVSPGAAGAIVTARFKNVPPSTILDTLLDPLGLAVTARDEALLISTRDSIEKAEIRTTLIPVRDVSYGLQDFPAPSPAPADEGAKMGFTGEDIANLIKNTVHKDSWEEADGKSIQYIDGLLIIRNTPALIRACAAFVEERRRHVPRQIALRADTAVLPAETVDAVLGPADRADDAQRERLLAGARVEPLSWVSHEEQRTSLAWSRSLDHVHDYSGEDPILKGHVTSSFLDVTPRVDKDGRTVRLDLRVEDARIDRVKETRVRDGITIETPLMHATHASTTLTLAPDRWAVLRWGLTPKEGEARKTRVLLIRAAPIP